jgi:eukaryotic-like serine/threonine-protein kinase
MPAGWEEHWRKLPGKNFVGGQGRSFLAESRDGTGQIVFVKMLIRHRDGRARGRFRREAVAYETLPPESGIPRLTAHNADAWEGPDELYLVLERISGQTLSDWMSSRSAMPPDEALACVLALAETVALCHAEGVLHRDIKPANLMLRDGDPHQPVLLDFGLSFNDREPLDITRVNEEVGNRFMRLPEHSFARRPNSRWKPAFTAPHVAKPESD